MKDTEYQPQTDAGEPFTLFRPRLGPLGMTAIFLTVVAYFGLKLATDLYYVFPAAAAVGLAYFLYALVKKYLPEGIRADGIGLADIGRNVQLRWDEIARIDIDIVKQEVGGRPELLKVVTVTADEERCLHFGNLQPYPTARLGKILNTESAPLLLALIAAKTQSRPLFPPAWDEDGADSESDQFDKRIEQPGGGFSARIRSTWGLIPLAFKILPKGGIVLVKLLKTIKPGAALLTFGAYSLIFSWKFAVALLLLIGFHELGHVFAMRRCGVPVKGIYFIPFFGGAAVGKGIAETRWQNAYISINGPIWGTLLAFLCLVPYLASGTDMAFFGALASWGALLNLFNLLPILPLDGGRLLNDLAYSMGGRIGKVAVFCSLLLGGLIAYFAGLELLVLMVIIGLIEFGGHLGAAPYGPTLALLGSRRPLNTDEFEHFSDLVSGVQSGRKNDRQVEARLQNFEHKKREGSQPPMTRSQSFIVLACYAFLALLLLTILIVSTGLPGAGDPIEFLK